MLMNNTTDFDPSLIDYNYHPGRVENPKPNQILVHSTFCFEETHLKGNYYKIFIRNKDGTYVSNGQLAYQIDELINYAIKHPELEFFICDIGWDSFRPEAVANLFYRALPFKKGSNVHKQTPIGVIKNIRLTTTFVKYIVLNALNS